MRRPVLLRGRELRELWVAEAFVHALPRIKIERCGYHSLTAAHRTLALVAKARALTVRSVAKIEIRRAAALALKREHGGGPGEAGKLAADLANCRVADCFVSESSVVQVSSPRGARWHVSPTLPL